MDLVDIPAALTQPWTGIYVRILAVVLIYGGLVHVGNMLGLNGAPWNDASSTCVSWTLFCSPSTWLSPWAFGSCGPGQALVVGIVLLQVIPYTLFRQYFVQRPEDAAALTGLVGTLSLLVGVLIVLILVKK